MHDVYDFARAEAAEHLALLRRAPVLRGLKIALIRVHLATEKLFAALCRMECGPFLVEFSSVMSYLHISFHSPAVSPRQSTTSTTSSTLFSRPGPRVW